MAKAPGKAHRKGLSLKKFLRKFPTDDVAEQWFIKQRWPQGICCPDCGSLNVQTGGKHKTMPFRCREKFCGKKFSTKTGSVMEGSKLGYQNWITAMFLVSTSLKGVASMKLHRDLDVTQKTAWFLSMRIRTALSQGGTLFAGPVEVDETYVGGRRRNMSNAQRKQLGPDAGRGPVGKTAVVGMKDRPTNQVAAKVVESTDRNTLQGFVKDHATPEATVYTDEASAYESLPFDHATVKHSLSQYVKGDAHTNGIESLWSMLKRGAQRHLPQNLTQTPEPLRPGVCRTAQHQGARHHQANSLHADRHGRQAVAVHPVDRRQRPSFGRPGVKT